MKKLSTKILLIGFAALVVIFVASRFFRSPARESNLRKELITLDTASVSEVRILPSKDQTEEMRLTRDGRNWKVTKGSRSEPSDRAAVKNILGVMANLQAQRLASRKKEKWEDFKVGETSTHVTAYAQGKKLADFHVGKVGFTQGGGGMYGGSYTYVRLSDENEVYTVDGFLEPVFNTSFNEWRDKTFLKLNKDDIIKLSFTYSDSGFVVSKRDSVWYIGNEKADPAKVDRVIQSFASKYLTEFVDGFVPPSPANAVIQVDGKSGNLVTLEGWKGENGEWTLTSSLQKGIYFSSKGSSVVTDILIGRKKFLLESKSKAGTNK
jgi:hypothetical protein